MGKRNKKRQLWHESPFDGVPGFTAAFNRLLFHVIGPAQLGKRGEPAYVPPADPTCPICRAPMRLHQFDRGGPGKPTYMRCPSAAEVALEANATQPPQLETKES